MAMDMEVNRSEEPDDGRCVFLHTQPVINLGNLGLLEAPSSSKRLWRLPIPIVAMRWAGQG